MDSTMEAGSVQIDTAMKDDEIRQDIKMEVHDSPRDILIDDASGKEEDAEHIDLLSDVPEDDEMNIDDQLSEKGEEDVDLEEAHLLESDDQEIDASVNEDVEVTNTESPLDYVSPQKEEVEEFDDTNTAQESQNEDERSVPTAREEEPQDTKLVNVAATADFDSQLEENLNKEKQNDSEDNNPEEKSLQPEEDGTTLSEKKNQDDTQNNINDTLNEKETNQEVKEGTDTVNDTAGDEETIVRTKQAEDDKDEIDETEKQAGVEEHNDEVAASENSHQDEQVQEEELELDDHNNETSKAEENIDNNEGDAVESNDYTEANETADIEEYDAEENAEGEELEYHSSNPESSEYCPIPIILQTPVFPYLLCPVSPEDFANLPSEYENVINLFDDNSILNSTLLEMFGYIRETFSEHGNPFDEDEELVLTFKDFEDTSIEESSTLAETLLLHDIIEMYTLLKSSTSENSPSDCLCFLLSSRKSFRSQMKKIYSLKDEDLANQDQSDEHPTSEGQANIFDDADDFELSEEEISELDKALSSENENEDNPEAHKNVADDQDEEPLTAKRSIDEVEGPDATAEEEGVTTKKQK